MHSMFGLEYQTSHRSITMMQNEKYLFVSNVATIILLKEIFTHTFEIQVKIQVFLKSLDYCVIKVYLQ